MRNAKRLMVLFVSCVVFASAPSLRSQDWPQWRGSNRDARVAGFKAPKNWPKELTKKWKVEVGSGVATPALVGDRLYVFTRQGSNEVVRCLNAATGEEVWQDKYEAASPTRPANGPGDAFVGPRCSPAVAEGKVVTLGARGTLSCIDATTGKKLWRKNDVKGWPRFFASSSPIIVDHLCIAQLGGPKVGGIVAYDLAAGDEKWKWMGDSPGYASPVLLTAGDTKVLIAETNSKIVGLNVADGKLFWETPYAVEGRGYNSSTPLVDGQTVIYTGSNRGTRAVKLEKTDSGLTSKEQWSNDNSAQFNTPVLADGLVFGLSTSNSLFCINAENGKTAWTASLAKGGGGRRGGHVYGSIVAAGPVLLVLTPEGQLIVVEPSDKAFKKLASYKVADGNTYGYPVVSGNRVFVQDKDSVTLWTIE
jgi:outer membrane protein assembly factor BamB